MAIGAFVGAAPRTTGLVAARGATKCGYGAVSAMRGTPLRGAFAAPSSLDAAITPARVSMTLVSVSAARTATLVYAIFMAAGGLSAYSKTGSTMSFISGATAAAVLVASYMRHQLELAFGTAVTLSVVFAVRYFKTRKVMPAVVLGLISVFFATLFYCAIKRI